MDPIVTGSLIGAGANLLGQGANAFASRKANKRMVDFWNMQNEYNSPRAQMQRLQEGGLNPNLIYGDGVSGATGQAEKIGAPDKPNFTNPIQDITKFQSLKQAKAQTDLTEQSINTEFQKGILAAEQVSQTSGKTRLDNQTFNQRDQLFKSSLQAAQLNVQSMTEKVLGQQLDNEFKNETVKQRIKNVYFAAKNAEANLEGRQQNNELLKLQREFLNLGLDRNSPWYAKIFGNIINKTTQK